MTGEAPGAGRLGDGPLATLRHRNFRVFMAGQLVSNVGTQVTMVAMSWQLYELTDSALQLGLIGLARGLPTIALLLVGGLLADAVDRRRLLISMQVGQLCVSSMLAGVMLFGAMSPLVLYLAAVLLGIFSSLEGPGRQALIPNLLPREEFTRGLALNAAQRNVAMLAGPSLGGLVLGAAGPLPCYLYDALSWLAMIAALLLMRGVSGPAAGRGGMSLESLREGYRFVRGHPVILPLMALDFGQNFFGAPRVLLPVFARDVLGVGPEGLGLLYAASSAGAIVTAGGFSFFGRVRRGGLWVLLGVGVYAVSTLVFAYSEIFWLSVLMLGGEGAGNMISVILRSTITQLATPDELRGRVTSVNSVFTQGGPQLGHFRAGVTAEWLGPQLSVFVGAAIVLAIVIGVACVPSVRRFELPSSRPVAQGGAATGRAQG
jgi:MFS family permease